MKLQEKGARRGISVVSALFEKKGRREGGRSRKTIHYRKKLGEDSNGVIRVAGFLIKASRPKGQKERRQGITIEKSRQKGIDAALAKGSESAHLCKVHIENKGGDPKKKKKKPNQKKRKRKKKRKKKKTGRKEQISNEGFAKREGEAIQKNRGEKSDSGQSKRRGKACDSLRRFRLHNR